MIRYNYHTHTTYSDGKNSPREMIEKAIELGFHAIGISDHAYTDFHPNWSVAKEKLPEYIREMQALKEEYKGKIRVFVGLEQDALAEDVPEGLDYYLGSVHWVEKNGRHIAIDNSYDILKEAIDRDYGGDALGLARDYYALLETYADDKKVAFIGHFDLLTKFDEKNPPLFPDSPGYREIWQKAADKLIAAGKVFEINTGAISRGLRTTPYPAEEILRYWAEKGAKAIISSDSHAVTTLNSSFDETERWVLDHGIPLIELF